MAAQSLHDQEWVVVIVVNFVSQTHEGREAVEEAIRAVDGAEPLPQLTRNANLDQACNDHLADAGPVRSRQAMLYTREHCVCGSVVSVDVWLWLWPWLSVPVCVAVGVAVSGCV